jgi:hypothetical protein
MNRIVQNKGLIIVAAETTSALSLLLKVSSADKVLNSLVNILLATLFVLLIISSSKFTIPILRSNY